MPPRRLPAPASDAVFAYRTLRPGPGRGPGLWARADSESLQGLETSLRKLGPGRSINQNSVRFIRTTLHKWSLFFLTRRNLCLFV